MKEDKYYKIRLLFLYHIDKYDLPDMLSFVENLLLDENFGVRTTVVRYYKKKNPAFVPIEYYKSKLKEGDTSAIYGISDYGKSG